ncbi:MAG: SusC/RagA family TonB-linked outer membrane protein [Chitinophagaceae bacterium]
MRRLLTLMVSMLLFFASSVFAQNKTVTGKVTDEKGVPVAGASVQAGKVGTTTGADGTFTLSVPANTKQLRVTYVGFESTSVSIGTSPMAIVLTSEDKSLSEVVVVGYGTQRKKDYTGNTASIKGSAVANRPVQSFDQALGGRAAGVQVNIPNGVLNAAPVIRVRGINSLSLSSVPLFVIDGVPTFTGDFSGTNAAANPLAAINPNDIESIDIAKDAAATAIYGSRAANGVVFVTTKKGSRGKAKVSYDGWIGWNQPFGLPKLLDAFQYTELKNEALRNANAFSATNQFRLTNGPDGKPINTNWYDVVYRTGMMHNNAVSVSGGNESTQYYMSVGYTEQEGILRRNDFKRLGILMNVDHKANKYISLGAKLQYTNTMNLASQSSGSLPGEAFNTTGLGRVPMITAPNVAPYKNDGTYNISGNLIGVMDNLVGQVGFSNPVVGFDLNRSNSEINQMQSNLYIQAKPFEFLTLKSVYALDYVYVDNELYQHPLSNEGFSNNGFAQSWFNKTKRWVWTNTAQFSKSFKKHNVSALIGVEQQKTEFLGYGLSRQNVNDPAFTNIQGGWTTPNTAGLGISDNYLYSEFASANYNFDRKYFIAANIRRDGASQLGANSKFGTFYGISGGWEISEEDFWKQSFFGKTFSSFKIRGSYGKVGNISGLGNYASLSQFTSGLYGGAGTVAFAQAGNNNLGWETSTKTDFGVNFGVLNNRITAELAYYKNNVNGLILNVPQPPSAGLPNAIATNIGSLYNEGFEYLIAADVVRGKNFTWRASINGAYNHNEVTSLAPGITQILTATSNLESVNITRPGYSIGQLFVTRTAGVDPATGRRIFINGAGRQVFFQHVAPPSQARFMYADGTTAPAVGSQDAVVYGNTIPRWTGGFDNTFRYKQFELNVLFTYQLGYNIYFGSNAGLRDQRFWNNSTDVLARWQKPGDVTEIPRLVFGDNISNGSAFPLDVNVFNGNFLKLRGMTFAYNLPAKYADKLKISTARFYVAGNNLLIFTKYPGPDPEVSSNGNTPGAPGVDRNTIANARSITVGLNIGF